jgi:hypothetical protein
MTETALRFVARDFEAYLPERATSNAFSRPRIELKQRALGWARVVAPRLAAAGLRLEITGSDETPCLRNKKRVECQWVFFRRDPADREELDRLLSHGRPISAEIDDPSAHKRHVLLGLRLDSLGVGVCVALHPDATIDVDNLRARLSSSTGADALVRALERLPEEFQVTVGETLATEAGDRVSVTAASPEALLGLLERAAATSQPLSIGWWVPRDLALAHAHELGEQLEDALVALAPVHRLVAWARDNDHISLETRLEGAERDRARAHAEAFAETERWRAERDAEREKSLERARERQQQRREDTPRDPRKAARHTLATLFKGAPAQARGRGKDAADGRAKHPPPVPPPAPPDDELGAGRPAAGAAAAVGVVDKGSRVRVLSGPFAHKLGVVSELDGRGGARVLLGLLSTRLDLTDLELAPNRRDRPALQSSHRSAPRKAR